MSAPKKRPGDRWDGYLMRDIDPMHFIMPHIWPGRCDNEAYISERIDIAPIKAWLEKENAKEENKLFPYTLFHIVVTAFMKTVTLRPKLSRFIANNNMYMRNEVTAAFLVKKLFTDDAEEGLAFIHCSPEETVFSMHKKLFDQISSARGEEHDSTSDVMEYFTKKVPRFLSRIAIKLVMMLDARGLTPKSFSESDPYYSTVMFSNIGSIGLPCGYHHLVNWGTNSIFCLMGKSGLTPSFREDGSVEMKETVDLGLTIDERLADGYYFAKSVRLFKTLCEHPELLEKPFNEEIEYK